MKKKSFRIKAREIRFAAPPPPDGHPINYLKSNLNLSGFTFPYESTPIFNGGLGLEDLAYQMEKEKIGKATD